ncbi:MAG: MMPL family transporter [Candidatus Aminicenantes bacterium]|nr:MAG: MMPL family transporter [Candidatus Aminicenantes bacterium]
MNFLKFLLRHRRLVVIFHFVFALAMLPGILQLENDNSPRVFFTRDAAQLKRYQRFRQEFGGGKAVRIALSGGKLWTHQGLAWLGELEDRAASLPGVEAAVGLAAHHRWLLLEWPPSDPAIFRTQVLENGLDTGAGWVSPDGEIITLLMVLADLSLKAEQELLANLDRLTARAPPGIRAHISGLPVLHRAMERSLLNTASRVLPLLALLAAAFLFFIFRRLGDTIIPLVFVVVCQGVLFGVMGYIGVRLNLVNIILALLIFVISLATAVHLQVRFRDLEQRGMKVPTAVLATYRSKGWAVLWTGITTLVAFGSLVTGNMPPVRSLGAWSALGIALMTLLAFTLYPALLAGIRPGPAQQAARPFEVRARRWGQSLAGWAIRRRFPVLVGTGIVVIVALLGVARFRVQDNIAEYFSPRHPIRAELERLQQHNIGVFAAELVLSYRNSNHGKREEQEASFQDPTAQQKLARLSGLLRSQPLVYGAVSSGDLVEASIRSILVEGEVDDNIRWMVLGMMQTVPEGRKVLRALLTADGQSARVTLLVPILSFNQMQPLFQRVIAQAKNIFPEAETWITGQYPLILLAQQTLLRGLMVSLSLTLLCIMLVFILLLRSIRLSFLVLIPNLWPVVLVLGGMGWLKFPLDSVSIMTASIILGLAVDDTFHTLGYFLRLAPRCGPARAVENTLERTAPAHILTTVILAGGFIACALSEFLPVSRMGMFATVAIFFALIGDLLLIPALLALRRGEPKKALRAIS